MRMQTMNGGELPRIGQGTWFLGEHPERVFNVGEPGVENCLHTPLLSVKELSENLQFDLTAGPYSVVTFHPVTLEDNTAERQLHELIAAMDNGTLEEAWGCGTAAVVSPIGKLACRGKEYIVNGGKIGEITQMLYDTLTGIQWGKLDDAFGWTHKI